MDTQGVLTLWHDLCKDYCGIVDGPVRRGAMAMDSPNDEYDTLLTTQAIIELTEANVSASGHGDEWEREVTFLHDSAADKAPGPGSDDLGEVLDLATALA